MMSLMVKKVGKNKLYSQHKNSDTAAV